MCGRYTQHHSTDQVVMRFSVDESLADVSERYNVAPTQSAPIVYQKDDKRVLASFRWGLIPSWAKDTTIGSKLLNARAETVAEKPSFRNALKRRRCLVPADGYYEWQQEGKQKRPILFQRVDHDLFAFAGLWEEWKGPDGIEMRTFTVITTTPNELAARTHDRMPAILCRDDEAVWLNQNPDASDAVTELLSLLRPYPQKLMEALPVSTRVNSVAFDDPALIVAITSGTANIQQDSLF